MAQRNLGKVAPSYKGDYVVGTYQIFDVVFDGESSFMSLKNNNVAALTPDGINWIYLCRGNAESALMKAAADDNEFRAAAEAICNLANRVQALEQFIDNAQFDKLTVNTLDVVESFNNYKSSYTELSGAGAPAIVPDKIFQKYLDTTNNVIYEAKGNTAVSDWKQTSN
jgi:hypothetical protein